VKPGDRSTQFLGDLAALLAGALLPLAFAPFQIFPLAIISPAILFRLWQGVSARRAFARGWLFGLGLFGVGISWVQVSIHQFGLPVLAFSVSATVLFVVILSLYPAAVGYLANRFFPGGERLRFLLALPALWTGIEWFRGWFLTGIPWLNLGYSQIDAPLAGLAPVLGVYGVSLAVAWSAGVLGYVFTIRRMYLIACLLPLWGGAWLLGQVPWTEPVAGEPLEVALIQGNVQQAIKWEPSQRQAMLEHYLSLTTPHWGKDLIIWPETAIPEFYSETSPYVQALKAQAKATGTDVLAGVPYLESREVYYNSVTSLGQGAFYHKRHLVPLGEFMPLEPVMGKLLDFLSIPMSSFTSGSHDQPLLRAAGQAIGVSICYEDVFGEEVIDALPEAGLLVNVSNDAWFGDSLAPHQHLEIARMRALETGRYLLRATNTGISAIIDEQGKVIARSPQFESHALTAKVNAYQGITPYARWGNHAIVLFLAILLALAYRLTTRPHPG
jgi:apolipoprotein N-acyltransferase